MCDHLEMEQRLARFRPGQLVHHLKFDYRGAVVDVDPSFQLSDEWYEQVARSRPPRDQPWYHVLVDGTDGMTYVAERHLEPDETGDPIVNPLENACFESFRDGQYSIRRVVN